MLRGENMSKVEPQSPPSSYAVAGVLDGEPGAWGRVITVTLGRAVIIAPGLYLGGVRGTKVITGALGAAVTITALLMVMYKCRKTVPG